MIKLDSHVDTLWKLYTERRSNFSFAGKKDLDVDIKKLKQGGINACFFAIWQPQLVEESQEVLIRVLKQYAFFQQIISENPSLVFSTSPKDIQNNINNNKISVFLGLENGVSIGNSIDRLNAYYTLGVRYLTLCHNHTNQLCDSSTDRSSHYGLRELGRLVIKEMNRIGMMIDISHLSDKSVEDVLEISELPVIASHSGCHTIYNNPRNINDKLLEKIAKNGGVIQVTLLPKCVGQNFDIPSFVNHIDHIYKLIGINHIGIGSDFDGGGGITGCIDISQVDNITKELRQRRYKKEEIDKVWGLNFIRVFNQNQKGG
jgi:membrane dipeptidase